MLISTFLYRCRKPIWKTPFDVLFVVGLLYVDKVVDVVDVDVIGVVNVAVVGAFEHGVESSDNVVS